YRNSVAPVGPATAPTGEPTILPQFANVVETSGASGAISTSANIGERYPASPLVVLQSSSFGNTFASGVPRYFLGDRITPPAGYTATDGTSIATPPSFWRAEPIRPGEIVTNPSGAPLTNPTSGSAIPNTEGVVIPPLADGVYQTFYYSPHAKAVFACQSGQVEIWWRSSLPDENGNYILVHETFSVSAATTKPVRTLYWTERSFSAPYVTIPSGRIVTV